MGWTTGKTLRAALVLGAGLAAGLLPATANADGWEKREMRSPDAAGQEDGGGAPQDSARDERRGEVKTRETKRKRVMDVRVEGLDSRRSYVVRDGEDRDVGSFRTNRRGKGRARITERVDTAGQALGTADGVNGLPDRGDGSDGGDDGGIYEPCIWPGGCDGSDDGDWWGDDPGNYDDWYCIAVYDEETGECVLTCEEREDDGSHDEFTMESGWATHEGDGGWSGYSSLYRMTWGEQRWEDFAVAAFLFDEENMTFDYWDFYANHETGLPLGVDSVADLAGRAFEARTADGDVVLSGTLPMLEDMGKYPYYDGGGSDGSNGGIFFKDGERDPATGGVHDDPNFWGPPEEWKDGSLVLHVENDGGVMEEIGSFIHYPTEDVIVYDDYEECPWEDGGPFGGDGSSGHSGNTIPGTR